MKGCRPFEGVVRLRTLSCYGRGFEEKFREEHNPLDESIIGLYCRPCHREYGSGNDQLPIITIFVWVPLRKPSSSHEQQKRHDLL